MRTKQIGIRIIIKLNRFYIIQYNQQSGKRFVNRLEIPHARSRIGNNSDASPKQPPEVLGCSRSRNTWGRKFSHGELPSTVSIRTCKDMKKGERYEQVSN